jgi:hypothetical protein
VNVREDNSGARKTSEPLEDLIIDLLEWLGTTPRPYAEVLDAWRTSCPRLPVWEEANRRGFIERSQVSDGGRFVAVSVVGARFLRAGAPSR